MYGCRSSGRDGAIPPLHLFRRRRRSSAAPPLRGRRSQFRSSSITPRQLLSPCSPGKQLGCDTMGPDTDSCACCARNDTQVAEPPCACSRFRALQVGRGPVGNYSAKAAVLFRALTDSIMVERLCRRTRKIPRLSAAHVGIRWSLSVRSQGLADCQNCTSSPAHSAMRSSPWNSSKRRNGC